MTQQSETDPAPGVFLTSLSDALAAATFSKLVLAAPRGAAPGLQRITIRPVTIKEEPLLSFVYSFDTRDITKNHPASEALATVSALLGKTFHRAHLLLTTGEIHLAFSRKGKSRLTRGQPAASAPSATCHNREKIRMLDSKRPFLSALGITDTAGRVLPSMSHKWKQINRFLELFAHAFDIAKLSSRIPVRVVDFGAGKGYLTFAVHDHLCNTLGLTVDVTGVEIRNDLVTTVNALASRLGAKGLTFCRGDLASFRPVAIDALIALHACDTATDEAIHLGIRSGAAMILCAPCCHKEIRPQLTSPDVLKPLLRFGIHAAQEAEMLTDTFRALLLEANGYHVDVLEFISQEHTDKNKMILATRNPPAPDRAAALARLASLKQFYGIREQRLEALLMADSPPTAVQPDTP